MGIVVWILIGVIGGWLSGRLTGRKATGDYALNIAVGIVGAIAAGFITNLVIFHPVLSANWQNGLVAVLGAALFLVVANLLRR
ncbi:MAG: GlsB/YeaQ/YmgE family stress response membrane protein [Candidatus Promineofilum sp.]|nr:GlsB/YeaQ/YmgE family stress response membrane protein [Promineifilum sp.]